MLVARSSRRACKSNYSPRLKRIIVLAYTNSVTNSRKASICETSSSVTTAIREFTPAIVLHRKLSMSREVGIGSEPIRLREITTSLRLNMILHRRNPTAVRHRCVQCCHSESDHSAVTAMVQIVMLQRWDICGYDTDVTAMFTLV